MTLWSTVDADYHQFFVSAPTADPTAVTTVGEIFDSGPNLIVVHTGVAAGPVRVGVSVLEAEPTGTHGEWEVVADGSVVVTDDLVVLTTLGDVVNEFGTISAPSTGKLMVRVSARGRDANWDLIVDEPTEDYLLECWPIIPDQKARAKVGRSRSKAAAKADPYGDRVADASARLFGPTKTK
ncbi:hypothetical protein ERC79_13180 [Rhodococcus sp. ABRD24]|uniref:hypothetical protein n=1 Tax=Rhodococcus sp. ABRD24 TaxID=2507582 RepID=UPI0010396E1C|nr:hypothetical protein [Rhodococcus sp. ABRD24]QBJ96801.1 hypothetical protein ERC79_13180 [Rhodococcus sp. ABRD24]